VKGLSIQSIQMTGFSKHNESCIDLPKNGVVLVTGPNGSGKSSMIDAVGVAFWNEHVRGVPLWRAKAAGAVTVLADGIVVERERTPSGSGKLSWSQGNDPPTQFESMTKAQTQLGVLVGPYEQWRRTHVLCAEDGESFTRASDSARKELLEQMLGVHGFEDAIERTTEARRQADKQAAAALVLIDASEKGMDSTQTLIDKIPKPTGSASESLVAVDARREELHKVQKLVEFRRELVVEYRGRLRDAESALSKATGLKLAHEEAKPVRQDACRECGQAIPPGDFAQQIEGWESKHRLLSAAELKAEARAEGAGKELETAVANERLARAEADNVTTAFSKAQAAYQSELDNERHAKAWKGLVDAWWAHSESRDKATLDAQKAEQELAVLHAVRQVLGPNGIRSVMLSDALAWLTDLSNGWLQKISQRNPLRVSIEPYAERAGGGVRNAVTIKVSTPGGVYKGCSKGEQKRLDVAILLGIAEMSQSMLGIEPGTMFVDEIVDGLDDEGVEAVCKALNEMARTRCVVVISHNERVYRALKASRHLHVEDGEVTECR
jgi:DNA repair exonuclease SbcCD ATPase subunit